MKEFCLLAKGKRGGGGNFCTCEPCSLTEQSGKSEGGSCSSLGAREQLERARKERERDRERERERQRDFFQRGVHSDGTIPSPGLPRFVELCRMRFSER
eukprot:COSAG03_NODE_13525_length_499_cov_73.522500_1_plen_98_part_10